MDNPFEAAGTQFRKQISRDTAAYDQSIAALGSIEKFCKDGIRSFYGKSYCDVYVERTGDSQLSIRYGFRAGKFGLVLSGPMTVIFVTPEGKVLWGRDDGWHAPGTRGDDIQGVPLDWKDLPNSLAPKLISFLEDAETAYRNRIA